MSYIIIGISNIQTFVLNGTKILSQSDGTNTVHFQYGANGIEGFTLNGTQYIYQKNILGDIIGIFDSNQQLVAKYTYDAWGNQRIFAKINNEFIDITQESTYTNNVANVNPIRYRGYYYDVETGFYYLNSRYYDPATCRFINADDISYVNAEILNGLNLYAYCGNNPITNVDENGNWNWNVFWKGLGLIFTAAIAIALSVTTFGAGIPLAMALIAGVTLAAGILTGINGVATIIEAGSGYNFVRDGVFQGDDNAYNLYDRITESVAKIGSLIIGVYHLTGHYKAAKASQQFLGKGYIKAGSNRWISADGLRQVRWDTTHHLYKGIISSNHFNWYSYSKSLLLPGRNKPISDIHVWIKLFKYIIK